MNLALSVLLTGFEKDESVKITGYATQSSGSMVTIFDTQTVDSVSFDGVANLTVNVTAHGSSSSRRKTSRSSSRPPRSG